METIITKVRKNIRELIPYSSARKEYKGEKGVFLDANENPFGKLNRYPDPLQKKLKEKIAALKNVSISNIFVGNGSDEVIDLALRVFCEPGKDSIIICPPTYGMYEVSAKINNITIINIPLNNNFQLQNKTILQQKNAKILFLCSPNNPTGNNLQNLEELIEKFKGIVFLDEAYIDFSNQKSLLNKLNNYPNLIISQTLSKAYGLAAARIGLAFASKEIIDFYNRIKPPYNVSLPNQLAALKAITNQNKYKENVDTIKKEKTKLIRTLKQNPLVRKIYPSEANFLLVDVKEADKIYMSLINQKIIVRNRNSVIKNTLRISIGTPKENQQLVTALQKIKL